jgi:hypothetical protein
MGQQSVLWGPKKLGSVELSPNLWHLLASKCHLILVQPVSNSWIADRLNRQRSNRAVWPVHPPMFTQNTGQTPHLTSEPVRKPWSTSSLVDQADLIGTYQSIRLIWPVQTGWPGWSDWWAPVDQPVLISRYRLSRMPDWSDRTSQALVRQACPTSWWGLWLDRLCPITGQTRVFELWSNTSFWPVNAGSDSMLLVNM